jgi:hypothetical protein
MAHTTLSRNAILVGLCALIPLPWIDGYLARGLCRRSWQEMATAMGHPMDDTALHALTDDKGSMVIGCLVGLFWWPIRKVFRTFFYFLTVKDAVDWGIETALRGEMVRRALLMGLLPGQADAVRTAMDGAFVNHRHSPITRWALRQPNPPLSWSAGGDPFTGTVGWLAQVGGGALVLDRFTAMLHAPPAAAPAALPAPDAPAPAPEVV